MFEALFDRSEDWADIEALVAARTLGLFEVRATIVALLGGDDHRVGRFDRLTGDEAPEPVT